MTMSNEDNPVQFRVWGPPEGMTKERDLTLIVGPIGTPLPRWGENILWGGEKLVISESIWEFIDGGAVIYTIQLDRDEEDDDDLFGRVGGGL